MTGVSTVDRRPVRPARLTRFSRSAGATRVLALVAALLCSVGFFAVPAFAEDAGTGGGSSQRVIENVHTDAVSAFVDDGQLVLDSRADVDGELGKRFDARAVLFHLSDAGRTAVPDNPQFGFLGVPGDALWLAPQVQNPAVIWPGFSTEHLSLRDVAEGQRLDVRLLGAQGPGRVEIYMLGSDGVERIFSSAEQLPAWQIGVPQHTHMNWAFTQPGVYTLEFEMAGHIGAERQAARGVFTFVVGEIGAPAEPEPVQPEPGEPGGSEEEPASGGEGGDQGGPSGPQTGPVPPAPPTDPPPSATPVSPPQECRPAVTLENGHIDAFAVSAGGGMAVLQLLEDVTGYRVLREAEDVLLRVTEQARASIPGLPGGPAGYVLPLSQNSSLIWPGWDTNRTAASGFSDVVINITAVSGPGPVYLYTSQGAFGGWRPILTHGGYTLPGAIHEPAPAHTHAQWVFSERGVYVLTAHAVARDPATGASLTTAAHTYVFQVGDVPLGDVFCGLSAHGAEASALVGAAVQRAGEEGAAAEEATAEPIPVSVPARGRANGGDASRADAAEQVGLVEAALGGGRHSIAVAGIIGGGALALAGIAAGTNWLLRRDSGTGDLRASE